MRVWLAALLLTVSFSAQAVSRVVSLSPSLSEMVVELGAADLLVGVWKQGSRYLSLPTCLLWAATGNWTWSVCSACNPTCFCFGQAVWVLPSASNCVT